MPKRSYSITLQLERDNDYVLLNGLRMAGGYPEHHPAHISLVTRLDLFFSPDLERSKVAILERDLGCIADITNAFEFEFLPLDPNKPFGKGSRCVALVVKDLASLRDLIRAVESR